MSDNNKNNECKQRILEYQSLLGELGNIHDKIVKMCVEDNITINGIDDISNGILDAKYSLNSMLEICE